VKVSETRQWFSRKDTSHDGSGPVCPARGAGGEQDLRRARRRGCRVPGPVAVRTAVPVRLLGRHLLQGQSRHRVVSQAVVVATGVAADGRREVLGFDVGDSEDGVFWTAFLRSLKTCGLHGTQLVISDHSAGRNRGGAGLLLAMHQSVQRRPGSFEFAAFGA